MPFNGIQSREGHLSNATGTFQGSGVVLTEKELDSVQEKDVIQNYLSNDV